MELTICKSVDLEDWYIIERSEHDGREWMESTDYGSTFRTSARFSDADVEGSAEHMRGIAIAIRARGIEHYKRCEVDARSEPVTFCSPRNSTVDGECSLAEADLLADKIETMLGKVGG